MGSGAATLTSGSVMTAPLCSSTVLVDAEEGLMEIAEPHWVGRVADDRHHS